MFAASVIAIFYSSSEVMNLGIIEGIRRMRNNVTYNFVIYERKSTRGKFSLALGVDQTR